MHRKGITLPNGRKLSPLPLLVMLILTSSLLLARSKLLTPSIDSPAANANLDGRSVMSIATVLKMPQPEVVQAVKRPLTW